MVHWLRICLATHRAQVRSLVRELRFPHASEQLNPGVTTRKCVLQRDPHDATKTPTAATKTAQNQIKKKNSYNTKKKKKKKIQVTRLKNRQRRHTNDQEVYKKLLNNTRHQGNANQNQNEVITSHLLQQPTI